MDESMVLNRHEDNYMDLFERIVNSYEKKISGFIFHMIHDKEAVKDLTQEVFIKVYKNLYKYNQNYPIEPWLYKIAHNITLNYIKKNKNRIKEISFSDMSAEEADFEAGIEDIQLREFILQEINSLKSDQKEIFVLRVLEDLSFGQIAEILNTSVASVKLKFYRSRKGVVKEISQYIKEEQI